MRLPEESYLSHSASIAAQTYALARMVEYQALHAIGAWPFSKQPGNSLTGSDLESLVAEIASWQYSNKLRVDGQLGPKSWAVARKLQPKLSLLPIPKGYAEVRRVYGDFKYTDKPGAGVIPVPSWKARFKTVTLENGKKLTFLDTLAEETCFLLNVANRVSGYSPKSIQTYVPRHKRGGGNDPLDESPNDLSMHCWCAFDVDPELNPWGNKLYSPLIKFPLFAAIFRVAGWSCGCDWSTPDTMHFQRARGV